MRLRTRSAILWGLCSIMAVGVVMGLTQEGHAKKIPDAPKRIDQPLFLNDNLNQPKLPYDLSGLPCDGAWKAYQLLKQQYSDKKKICDTMTALDKKIDGLNETKWTLFDLLLETDGVCQDTIEKKKAAIEAEIAKLKKDYDVKWEECHFAPPSLDGLEIAVGKASKEACEICEGKLPAEADLMESLSCQLSYKSKQLREISSWE